MGRIITFNVTKLGASHVKSGKPCQDYSLNWQSEDKGISIAIVCDGHGGETYVRSDRGSRLAAEITLQCVKEMLETVSPELFIDKEGAVTARPEEEEDNLFPSSKNIDLSQLDGIKKDQYIQDQNFYKQVKDIRQQDQIMNHLFASIYIRWIEAITKDAENDPFNEYEKTCLKNAKIVKAYGSTLMAFVRTPLYWFAFHIGDGKMLSCDINMKWREPVPWDCNCFLNYTTSLCGSNPINDFRYAFSGNGDFPIAVIMGSDGIDDSWCTMDRLQNFYSQTLGIFNEIGETKAVEELGDYLEKLSQKGSRDDMSMAGIIDMDAIQDSTVIYKKQKEINAIRIEKEKRESELSEIAKEHEKIEADISAFEEEYNQLKEKHSSWLLSFEQQAKEREVVIEKMLKLIEERKKEIELVEEKYKNKNNEYQEWILLASEQKNKLEEEYKIIENQSIAYVENEILAWNGLKELFRTEKEKEKFQQLTEKAAYMSEYSNDAIIELHKFSEENINETKMTPDKAEGTSDVNLQDNAVSDTFENIDLPENKEDSDDIVREGNDEMKDDLNEENEK